MPLGRFFRKLTARIGAKLTDSLDDLLPQRLAYCLRSDQGGNVTNKGTRRFAGQPVVVLADKGDRPGVAPGRLYVAASGPALPLRVVQTGPSAPVKPARSDPLCDSPESTTTASDIRFTAFDEPLRIVAPRHAVPLSRLAGAAS